MQTRDGRNVEVVTRKYSGTAIFKTFGTLDGKPCFWTAEGKYRMDDKEDPRDIVGF